MLPMGTGFSVAGLAPPPSPSSLPPLSISLERGRGEEQKQINGAANKKIA